MVDVNTSVSADVDGDVNTMDAADRWPWGPPRGRTRLPGTLWRAPRKRDRGWDRDRVGELTLGSGSGLGVGGGESEGGGEDVYNARLVAFAASGVSEDRASDGVDVDIPELVGGCSGWARDDRVEDEYGDCEVGDDGVGVGLGGGDLGEVGFSPGIGEFDDERLEVGASVSVSGALGEENGHGVCGNVVYGGLDVEDEDGDGGGGVTGNINHAGDRQTEVKGDDDGDNGDRDIDGDHDRDSDESGGGDGGAGETNPLDGENEGEAWRSSLAASEREDDGEGEGEGEGDSIRSWGDVNLGGDV